MVRFFDNRRTATFLPVALLAIGLIPNISGVKLPIEDSFHRGESFAAAITLLNQQGSRPLTIHGAWDFLLTLIARLTSSGEAYIFNALYLNQLVSAASAIMLLLFLQKLLKQKKNTRTTIFLCIAAVLAPEIVGIRDIFLIGTIWMTHELIRAKNNDSKALLAIFLVSACLIGGVWSFDRGAIQIFFVTSVLTCVAFFEHKKIFIFLAFLNVLGAATGIWLGYSLGLIDYISNFIFLTQTASQWRFPTSISTSANTLLGFIFVASAICYPLGQKISVRNKNFLPFLGGLYLCALLMLKASINRADLAHVFSSLWVPLIIIAYSYAESNGVSKIRFLRESLAIMLAISSSAYFVLPTFYTIMASQKAAYIIPIFFAAALMNGPVDGERIRATVFLGSIAVWSLVTMSFPVTFVKAKTALGEVFRKTRKTPIEVAFKGISYSEIADSGNKWAATKIRNSRSECILDMTNSGMINAGVNLPTCTRYAYPVYATRNYESDLLTQVRNTSPNAIVYSTENWQYSIDGKGMRVRFPKLDTFLRRKYPIEECNEKYCVRSRIFKD